MIRSMEAVRNVPDPIEGRSSAMSDHAGHDTDFVKRLEIALQQIGLDIEVTVGPEITTIYSRNTTTPPNPDQSTE